MLFYVSLILTSVWLSANGYKILFIAQMPSGSHYILSSRLASEIAKNGHQVTFVTPYPRKEVPDNIEEIPIESLQNAFQKSGFSPFSQDNSVPFKIVKRFLDLNYDISKILLSSDQMQKLLNSDRKFDAVIVYYFLNEALFPIAQHFKAPLILFKSMPLFVTESFMLSHPNPSSYVGNLVTGYSSHMNFWQRLENSFHDITMILYHQWFILPKHQQLAEKYIPGQTDLLSNTESLLLINAHVSTNPPIPTIPNVIEIGGYHIEPPKPLPNDIEKFLNESTEGVIVFSMGTITKSADFPEEKREAVLKAFANLTENVIWKFENEKLPGLPNNVKIMKWLPLSDILAHPNIKLFITHGGLLSTLESVYHGVPIVGIPLFTDQRMNMASAKASGYCTEVSYHDLTEQTLSKAIKEVLTNSNYKKSAQKRSRILKDRPMSPSKTAVYWIEYVIRHEGAGFLRYAGKDLNWFQRNLIDVGAFVIAIMLILLFASLKIYKRNGYRSRKPKTQ